MVIGNAPALSNKISSNVSNCGVLFILKCLRQAPGT